MVQSRENNLSCYFHPRATMAEALRRLRTNLQFVSVDKPMRSLVITSATPGDGKTTIASNLAVIYAQAGSKVLLIDGDLRRPTLHQVFSIPNIVGLSSLMIGACQVKEAIQETTVPGVSVILSGPLPPNPAELLGSERMKNLVTELQEQYDLTILDSPPVAAVSDPLILSTLADGTLLVVAHGRTKRDLVQQAASSLKRVKANMVGVVMNQVPADGSEYYYYSKHYGE